MRPHPICLGALAALAALPVTANIDDPNDLIRGRWYATEVIIFARTEPADPGPERLLRDGGRAWPATVRAFADNRPWRIADLDPLTRTCLAFPRLEVAPPATAPAPRLETQSNDGSAAQSGPSDSADLNFGGESLQLGEREGLAPRMKEPQLGEREGLAPPTKKPQLGEREGPALPTKKPQFGERQDPTPPMNEPQFGERQAPTPRMNEPQPGDPEAPAPRIKGPNSGEREVSVPNREELHFGEHERPAPRLAELLVPPPPIHPSLAPHPLLHLLRSAAQQQATWRQDSYRWLPAPTLSLKTQARRLGNSPGLDILWHGRWMQPVPGRSAGEPLMLAVPPGPGRGHLSGTLQVTLGRYLHFNATLWLEPPPTGRAIEPASGSTIAMRRTDPEAEVHLSVGQFPPPKRTGERAEAAPYLQLEQARTMRSGELHYLDHPRMGILVRIDRLPPSPALVQALRAWEAAAVES